jgi:hypothetical protein
MGLEKGNKFFPKIKPLVVLALIIYVGDNTTLVGGRNRECSVPLLPFKRAMLWKSVVDPF